MKRIIGVINKKKGPFDGALFFTQNQPSIIAEIQP